MEEDMINQHASSGQSFLSDSLSRFITRQLQRRCTFELCVVAWAALTMTGAAAEYPDRPIRLISVGAPGATPDMLSRRIGVGLTEVFKKQIVVDNRAGGGGVIASDLTAKAPADGYTILMTYHQHTVNASLVPKLPYRTVDDFTPITQATAAALVLVVHPSAPVNNMREFIDWTKNFKEPLNFGSAGNGSGGHLAGELYKVMTGVKAQHIPYKSSAAALLDLSGNRYQFNFTGMQTSQAYVRGGRLKAIAVTSLKRVPGMPDMPSVHESGLPGFEIIGWYGLLGPAGIPAPILNRLHTEIVRILQQQDFRDRVSAEGADVVTNTPEKFREFLKADVAKWAKLLKESGAKLD
jgi:tripartite-type tricarboxylate transporter receptor subunit TctC